MAVPQWTPDLSVGNDVLDGHHQTLFTLLAEIDAGITAGLGEDWARAICQRLTEYMGYHFREEEALQEAAGFPFLQFHRGSHQAIAMRLSALLGGLGQQSLAQVMADIRDFLADWLTHHIEIEDFEYKPYLSQLG